MRNAYFVAGKLIETIAIGDYGATMSRSGAIRKYIHRTLQTFDFLKGAGYFVIFEVTGRENGRENGDVAAIANVDEYIHAHEGLYCPNGVIVGFNPRSGGWNNLDHLFEKHKDEIVEARLMLETDRKLAQALLS